MDVCLYLKAQRWCDKSVIASLSSPASPSVVSRNGTITSQHSFLTHQCIRDCNGTLGQKKAEICMTFNLHCKVEEFDPEKTQLSF